MSPYKKREDYNNDGDYGKYIKSILKPGMKVRALYDYESIIKGDIGIFKRSSFFSPPAQFEWTGLEGKTHWIQWHMVEILPPSQDTGMFYIPLVSLNLSLTSTPYLCTYRKHN